MTSDAHFKKAAKKAAAYGIDLNRSTATGKKYMFRSPESGRIVRFGALGYDDYLTHKNKARRADYRRRHAGIFDSSGHPAYLRKYSPAWASYYILW